MPVTSNVTIKVALRPIRSPQWPNIAAPIGRPTKPTKKTLNASSTPTIGSDWGKKSLPKTSPVTWPYSRKSYHSIVVPTVLAITARRKCALCSVSESPPAVISAVVIEFPPDCRAIRRRPLSWPRHAAVRRLNLGDADRRNLTFLAEPSPGRNFADQVYALGTEPIQKKAFLAGHEASFIHENDIKSHCRLPIYPEKLAGRGAKHLPRP